MSDMGLGMAGPAIKTNGVPIGRTVSSGNVSTQNILSDNDTTVSYAQSGLGVATSSNSDYIDDLMGQLSKMKMGKEKTQDEEKKDAKFRLALKIVIAVIIGLGLLEILFYKIVIPSVASPLVSVSGQKNYSAVEIVDMLRSMNVTNWFGFDSDRAVLIISSASGIDSVSVKKSFPNKIYINIVERVPVALTFVNVDKKSVALQIDKNGVLFSERGFKSNNNVPIISGLPINHLSEGMRIGEQYRLLIEQIAAIQKLSQNYFAAISEICVVPKENGNYELVIIPSKSKIRIITDRNLTEDTLKYMMIALDVVSNIDKDAKQINMRGGVISYIK